MWSLILHAVVNLSHIISYVWLNLNRNAEIMWLDDLDLGKYSNICLVVLATRHVNTLSLLFNACMCFLFAKSICMFFFDTKADKTCYRVKRPHTAGRDWSWRMLWYGLNYLPMLIHQIIVVIAVWKYSK